MEQWVDKVLETDTINKEATTLIQVTESVETIEEQEVDGAEEEEHHHNEDHENDEEHEHEEGAFDEHIWTSPSNAIKMVEYLNEKELLIKYPQGEKRVTPGQACVLYNGDECLGGGIIKEVRKDNKKLWYL